MHQESHTAGTFYLGTLALLQATPGHGEPMQTEAKKSKILKVDHKGMKHMNLSHVSYPSSVSGNERHFMRMVTDPLNSLPNRMAHRFATGHLSVAADKSYELMNLDPTSLLKGFNWSKVPSVGNLLKTLADQT